MTKRTLFIGDVHGCYDELMALCEKICLQDEDHLYFVGDLINKGPKSLEVVEFVRNRPNTFSVIGNHEHYLLRGEAWDGGYISDEAREITQTLEEHKEWLLSLPTIIEQEHFIVVHGGLHPDYGLSTPTEIATLIRVVDGKPWYESYTGEKLVIYGHWAAAGLRVTRNTIGLDTGCCFGGHLTTYCLESGEIWQVRANKVYKEPSHWHGGEG